MLTEFIKIQNFKVTIPDVELSDTKFMSAKEKQDVLKKWVAFLSNHFKPTLFNKALYNHLHLHCGYIAYYNQHGFFGNYFETPSQFHWLAFGTKKTPSEYDGYLVAGNHVGKDALESKEAFLKINDEIQLSFRAHVNDARLSGFLWIWNTSHNAHIFGGDYGDLNRAMRTALDEYFNLWGKAIEEAEQKRIRHEIKAQRERMSNSLLDAADQLTQIEQPIAETPKSTASMSLLDFLLDDGVAV